MPDVTDYRQAVAGLSPAQRQLLAARLRELSPPGEADGGQAGETDGGPRLLAYVVPAAGHSPSAGELREFLRQQLPDYMVPADFVMLDELPVSASGKIDRRALLEAGAVARPAEARALPRGELERTISGFWREVLPGVEFGRDDNFFDLGGHSLLLIQVNRSLKDYCRREIPIVEMFRHPTIATLAAFLSGRPHEREADASEKARGRAALRREAGRRQSALRQEHRARGKQ